MTLTFTSQKYGGIVGSIHLDRREFNDNFIERSRVASVDKQLYLHWHLRQSYLRHLLAGEVATCFQQFEIDR